MREFTLAELTVLLRKHAGEDDESVLQGDILDVSFADLGYDSIALMETTGHIEVDYRVTLDEDNLAEADTPRALIDLVNRSITTASQ